MHSLLAMLAESGLIERCDALTTGRLYLPLPTHALIIQPIVGKYKTGPLGAAVVVFSHPLKAISLLFTITLHLATGVQIN